MAQSANTLLRLARSKSLQVGRAATGYWAGGVPTTSVRNFAEEAAKAATAAPPPPPPPPSGGWLTNPLVYAFGLAGIGGIYLFQQNNQPAPGENAEKAASPQPKEVKKDYQAVRAAIAKILDVEGYDDGSYGPILVRLAWHASGTYDKKTNTGGSNGATMRFPSEAEHGANAGLKIARDLLEPIKQQFPWISYADLWTLAGCVAIEEMGGPVIPWRAGRVDRLGDENACPPDGRLPDAAKGATHIRDIFYRMGFNDQEIVALLGAHTLGRCHTDRSGFVNPWTNAPTTFSNLYFTELSSNKWKKKRWNGPMQYEDPTGQLMMLPADMALFWDKGFKKFVQLYAKDEELFFKDFASAFSKLLELGVPFTEEAKAV